MTTPPTQLLAMLARVNGDEPGLRSLATQGNTFAIEELADLLYERRDEFGLRQLADAGNEHAVNRLAEMLYLQGDEFGLRLLVEAGNKHAADQLKDLTSIDPLIDESSLGTEGARSLRARTSDTEVQRIKHFAQVQTAAEGGDVSAMLSLAETYYAAGRYVEAAEYFQQIASLGLHRMATALSRAGRSEATQWRKRAQAVDEWNPERG